jgi:SAM-dependent methyltransferase
MEEIGIGQGKGSGSPSVRSSLSKLKASLIQAFRDKNFILGKNAVIAQFSNILNFHVLKNSNSYCPFCNRIFRSFIATAHNYDYVLQSRCPNCNSGCRHRGLLKVYEEYIPKGEIKKLISVSPEPIIISFLSNTFPLLSIKTTDLFLEKVDYPKQDLQNLSIPEKFDFLICNHVIEHIPDDHKAISECSSILNKGGIAIFTIPGDFTQEKTITFQTPDNNGHFRHYGMEVTDVFGKYFEKVETINMHDLVPANWRVSDQEIAFVCTK